MTRINRIAGHATFGFRLALACAALIGATIVVVLMLAVSGVLKC